MHHLSFFNIHKIVASNKEMKELYLHRLLQSFSLGLIGIFVPIHLMKLGYSLNQAIIYIIALYAGMLAFTPVSSKISSKLGVKHTIALSFPLYLIYFWILFYLKYPSMNYIIIGLIYGIANVIYWISLNSDFSRNSHKIKLGKEFSILSVIPMIAGIIAPIIGASIITYVGFNVLMLLIALILILSYVPFFMSKDYSFSFDYKFSKLFDRKYHILFRDFLVKGILFGSNGAWPLYVFIVFGSKGVMNVGLAATLGSIGAMLFTLTIGKLSDKYDKVKILRIGGLTNLFIWTLAIFFRSPTSVMVLSLVKGFFFIMIDMPMFLIACEQTDKKNNLEFMTLREIGLSIGRLFLFIIILLLPMTLKFQIAFLMSSIS
ncbi:MAG: MFS transporter, partial [Candidatus Aenigmarchaeota archaeon]|nr:MFS transporter [Candidatus Aenigmarchaeota archaeon]